MKSRITFILLLVAGFSFAQTWEKLNYSFPKVFLGVMNIYSSPNNVLVASFANQDLASYISMDGGTTWQQIFADKAIKDVQFADNGTIYLFSASKVPNVNSYKEDSIYTSTDGVNWTAMNFIPLSFDNLVTANNTLYFTKDWNGSNRGVSKSTDGGASWTMTNLKSSLMAASSGGDTIVSAFMSPWPGGIDYSHDGGVTVDTAANWSAGGSIPIRTPDGNIYAATVNQIHKSTDGGQNYATEPLSSNVGQIHDFKYSSGNFFLRVSGGIWQTSDFANVTAATAGIPNWQLTFDMAVSDNYLYAITDTNIYRLAISNVSSVNEEKDYHSATVYPNPFSEKSTIYLDNQFLTNANLKVYNVQGKLILTADKLSGNSINLERENLPAGIYYFQITENLKTQARGNFIIE